MKSWLETALDYGISEFDFWNMTLAEITRSIESKHRVQKRQAQEKASFDYILADLIGRSISRIHSSDNTMPKITEVYPSLFEEEKKEEVSRIDELSAARFNQFAQYYNKKYEEVSNK